MSINITTVTNLHPDVLVNETQPFFINNLTNSKEDREKLNAHVHTTLTGDMSVKPSCTCRYTVDHIALAPTGSVCPKCGTPVCTNVERELLPTLFLKCPEGINTLLLPNFLLFFRNAFGVQQFDTLSWLCNTNYRKYPTNNPIYKILVKAGVQRGWNNFTANIEPIMRLLLNESATVKAKQVAHDCLGVYLKHKDSIHCQNLYFPSSVLFVIEATAVGNYLDFIFALLKDVVLSLTGVDLVKTQHKRENIIGRNLIKLCEFFAKYLFKTYGGKPGILRTGLMSAKGIYVMRAVVTGITDSRGYGGNKLNDDEIHLPWSGSIMMLRTHIVSKLLRRKMLLNDILKWIHDRVHHYCPDMESILNELVNEAGPEGLPCTMQRFPSLTTGSFMKVYATRIKPDPKDWTIGVSLLMVRPYNMDQELSN
jgi:hypothetical protein